MHRRRHSHGLTLIEVLLLIGILTSFGIMLLPWLQSAREKSRRLQCLDHMRKLGRAYRAYEETHKKFVSSSGVTRDAEGKIQAVDGWSWMVQLLPFMETRWNESPHSFGNDTFFKDKDTQELYNRLDVQNGRPLVEPADAKGTPHADALATSFPWMLCPSYGGSYYTDSTKKEAITNYRPIGATHWESLSVASPNPSTPKYGLDDIKEERKPSHPDGCCFPGSAITNSHIQRSDQLMWLTESLEPRFARWTVGSEAAVVGFPRNIEFEKDGYWSPAGHNDAMNKDPNSTYWSYHTYLDWDYDQNPYDGEDGTHGGKFGPSSNHPGVVNHAFVDGSAHSIRREIDASVYMYLINASEH